MKPGNGQSWWLDGPASGHTRRAGCRAFEKGVGTFYADDTLDERPIRVHFCGPCLNRTGHAGEQAFSPDAGATSETNWIMNFAQEPD
ncbi:MAG: hypothetical protein IPP88_21970 [Betaproteobacteria bacterium]|nr:hypothetical protein [Betaproteobacteria bacterium]